MDFSKLWDQTVIGELDIGDPAFINLINYVLEKIPAEFENDFPTFCIYEKDLGSCAYLDSENNILFDVEKIKSEARGNDNIMIGIIVELFALVFTKSKTPNLRLVSGDSLLTKAAQLVSEWGLSDELEEYHNVLGRVILFELPNRPDIYG